MSSSEEPVFAGEYGQLTPVGGGDPIPLLKKRLMIGRRGEADIQLGFKNISTQHCRLTLEQGYWFIRDLNSRNGVKVDNRTVTRKRVIRTARSHSRGTNTSSNMIPSLLVHMVLHQPMMTTWRN